MVGMEMGWEPADADVPERASQGAWLIPCLSSLSPWGRREPAGCPGAGEAAGVWLADRAVQEARGSVLPGCAAAAAAV